MSAAATLAEALEPMRADPARAAVLLDIDGTLAPITRHAADASVPEPTRVQLIAVAKRYGLVGCISGRQSSTARQMVSLGSIAYVGNHGAEMLPAGGTEVEIDPEIAAHVDAVRSFASDVFTAEMQRLRVRPEDKRAIAAFHWRGAPDEDAAEAAVREVAEQAHAAGLATHWGRKVLEVRPPVAIDKGRGVRLLLGGRDFAAGLYVGDDRTDLDAFAALRALVAEGELGAAVCVGVRSDETLPELEEASDLMVDGPPGVRELLSALAS
ncbi:MAG: trehalose 6-phosphate phosphatase [Solirubrobacteraceae bacterium]|jgi:trehalose 6-phosphate phosphatase|nr:trehalose 6-phosphate phosphatase [Solirubrobacteraceae bacterium]